jgi:hypothetical protein
VEGGTDRLASWAASRSAHFISIVSRYLRRYSSSVARSPSGAVHAANLGSSAMSIHMP